MNLLEVLELSGLDELINVLTLYYFFKLGNVAVIFMGNLGDALFKIYEAWTEGI